jgi:hypothetical protein
MDRFSFAEKCGAFFAIERRASQEAEEGLGMGPIERFSFAENAEHFSRSNGVRPKKRRRV